MTPVVNDYEVAIAIYAGVLRFHAHDTKRFLMAPRATTALAVARGATNGSVTRQEAGCPLPGRGRLRNRTANNGSRWLASPSPVEQVVRTYAVLRRLLPESVGPRRRGAHPHVGRLNAEGKTRTTFRLASRLRAGASAQITCGWR
jgi:hypothetical protein